MIEIGNVKIKDEFYSGNDQYSDGDIENDLLEIAKNISPDEYDNIIGERKSWPILYHFSKIRENIVSWLPIDKEDKVLEVGAGCGAVTGALCKLAKQVDAIELSMRRSEINAWRHKDIRNLIINVGNFQDVERSLSYDYEWITLIGVFEYAQGFIRTDSPYLDFLKIIKKHLKKDGRLVIAIENKFGLKYWAGCREDHTGNLFQGLEGYHGVDFVRTFGKQELTDLCQNAGFSDVKFYYPYPDYKLPEEIFSDDYLPSPSNLIFNHRNFDRDRLDLFNETKVYEGIIKEGMFPFFSNSFLVVLSGE